MLLNFHLDEHLQFLYVFENFVLRAWQMLHDPGKDVVHLKDGSTLSAQKDPKTSLIYAYREVVLIFACTHLTQKSTVKP